MSRDSVNRSFSAIWGFGGRGILRPSKGLAHVFGIWFFGLQQRRKFRAPTTAYLMEATNPSRANCILCVILTKSAAVNHFKLAEFLHHVSCHTSLNPKICVQSTKDPNRCFGCGKSRDSRILGLHWGYIRIMEKKMETTI